MSWIESQLREALRRREPRAGFAERVMARIEREGAEPLVEVIPHRPWLGNRWWFRFAAAAAVALLIAGGGWFEVRQEREARERAQAEQVMAALQLTAGKLHSVRARIVNVGILKRAGRPEGVEEE